MKSLQESLLDDDDKLFKDTGDVALIEKFLKENYIIKGNYKINNRTVDVNGSVTLKSDTPYFTNDLFKFGKVSGYFDCDNCENLKSLKGAPEEVTGDFNCSDCINLKNLEGAPKIVGGNFDCSGCDKLKSFNGLSKSIINDFDCVDCYKIKDLKGLPEKINGNLFLTLEIESLEGGPKEVGGEYVITDCKHIDIENNLDYLPRIVGDRLFLPRVNIKYVKNGYDKMKEIRSYLAKNITVGKDIYINKKRIVLKNK